MPRRKQNRADPALLPIDGGEDAPAKGHNIADIAGDRLRSFIERVENLEAEKATIQADIKEVYAEAKGNGFDTKIIRIIVKERRMDADDLAEQQDTLAIYKEALGMFVDTPLGAAAISRVSPKLATAAPNPIAREMGFADGLAGGQDHAGRYAPGESGHGDYALGLADGQQQRERAAALAADTHEDARPN